MNPEMANLDLRVVGRNPLKLSEETVRAVMGWGIREFEMGTRADANTRTKHEEGGKDDTGETPVLQGGGDSLVDARKGGPLVSIVIVTFNNLVLNKMCLRSVLGTVYPAFEVIVVDNASSDGTREFLSSVAGVDSRVRVILSEENEGFARGNNRGLAAARGDVLVLLNNDTVVPPGWLGRLVRHLEEPAIGVVGAVTNRIGTEAEVEISYRTWGEMVEFAEGEGSGFGVQGSEEKTLTPSLSRSTGRGGNSNLNSPVFDIPMAAMFCLGMRREVFERVGAIDEQFERGMFEDDDYCMRVRAAGLRVVCAEDVFVHHFGGASFGDLIPSGEHGRIFEANRERFEKKWGVKWRPHGKRANAGYSAMVEEVREAAGKLPRGSTILVVSKGDGELLKLEGQKAWHFPRREDGVYAGHYPADSRAAIEHLESLREKGAEYLIFPASAMWWLEHYSEFRGHLENQYEKVSAGKCAVFSLKRKEAKTTAVDWREIHLRELCAALLPEGARVVRWDGEKEAVAGSDYVVVPETKWGCVEEREELCAFFEREMTLVARRERVGRIYRAAEGRAHGAA